MKRIISLALTLALAMSMLLIPASANAPISIYVDGIEISSDVPPQIVDGRTLVPVRAISEATDCTVQWRESDQSVIIYPPYNSNDALLEMKIGNPVVTINSFNEFGEFLGSSSMTIDVPPMIIDDRTMVPFRFIGELLGFDVGYTTDDWGNPNSVYLEAPSYDYEDLGYVPQPGVYTSFEHDDDIHTVTDDIYDTVNAGCGYHPVLIYMGNYPEYGGDVYEARDGGYDIMCYFATADNVSYEILKFDIDGNAFFYSCDEAMANPDLFFTSLPMPGMSW